MRKILVKISDYVKYISENKTDKLDNKNIIFTKGSFPRFLSKNINEEIFNGVETEYKIESSEDSYIIKFLSKSEYEYRFDIIREPNTRIYHLAFSLSNFDFDSIEYHDLTNKMEQFDIFNRLIWILKDITPSLDIDEYCIGSTGSSSKDNIYEYMMRFVSGWEKRKTDQYPLGWAIYFKL